MFSNRDAAVVLGHSVGVLARLAAEVGHEVAAGELVRRPPEGLRRDRGVVAGGAPSNRSGRQSASARRWQLTLPEGSWFVAQTRTRNYVKHGGYRKRFASG